MPVLDFARLGPCAGGAGASSSEEEETDDEEEEAVVKEVESGDTDLLDLWQLWDTELAFAHSAEKRAASEIALMNLLMAKHGQAEVPTAAVDVEKETSLNCASASVSTSKATGPRPIKGQPVNSVVKDNKGHGSAGLAFASCFHCGGTCSGPCEFSSVSNPFAVGGAVNIASTAATTATVSKEAAAAAAKASPSPTKKRKAAPSVAEMLMFQLDSLASDTLLAPTKASQPPSQPAPPQEQPTLRDPRPGALRNGGGSGLDLLSHLEYGEPTPYLDLIQDDAKAPPSTLGKQTKLVDGPGLATLRAEGEARRLAKQEEMQAKRAASPAKFAKGRRKPGGASPVPAQIAVH